MIYCEICANITRFFIDDVCPLCKHCIFDPFRQQTLDFYNKNREILQEILTEYDKVINFSLEYNDILKKTDSFLYKHYIGSDPEQKGDSFSFFEDKAYVPKQYIYYNREENYVLINFFGDMILLRENQIAFPKYHILHKLDNIGLLPKEFTGCVKVDELEKVYYGTESKKFILALKDGSEIQPISFPLETKKLKVVYWFFQQFLKEEIPFSY